MLNSVEFAEVREAVAKIGDIRVGISGWRYQGWRGVFYPQDWPQRRELEYASRIFRTIEINGTFYSLQRPESFAAWAATTPDDFLFAVKGPRFITHLRRLKEAQAPLANFFASGFLHLAQSSARSCGSFRPISSLTPSASNPFLSCCPATRKEPPCWRAAMSDG